MIGFNTVKGCEKLLVASVLENFFGAIWKGKLSVKVGDELISKETIIDLFNRAEFPQALQDTKGEPEAFNNAKQYLSALVGIEEAIIENQENRELGNCEVRIIVGDHLPKRVAVLRNGMFITDQMDHLKRFGDFKEFVAVVECQSKKGNELLRDMEPPKHDDFEPERLPTGDQPKGQRALSELGRWVRDMLKRHARDPIADVSEVKELTDYFADDIGPGDSGAKGEEVNPVGQIQIRAQPLRRSPVIVKEEEHGEEGGTGEGKSKGGGGSGDGTGEGSGSGGKGSSSSSLKELTNVRSVKLSDQRRRVSFTPAFTGKMELGVYEAGADTDRRLTIIRSTVGKVRNGTIHGIPVQRGVRVQIELDLDMNFLGAMKVVGHEI